MNPHASHHQANHRLQQLPRGARVVVYVLQRLPRLRGARRLGESPGRESREGGTMMKKTAAAVCRGRRARSGRNRAAARGFEGIGLEGCGERRAAGHAPGRPVGAGGAGGPGREGRGHPRRRRVPEHGQGMEGPITVTLLVQDSTPVWGPQGAESQSRGGCEAIRDGRFMTMIEDRAGAGCRRATRRRYHRRRASSGRWRTPLSW